MWANFARFRAVIFLHRCGAPRLPRGEHRRSTGSVMLIADRFPHDDDGKVMDLATAETVRLTIEPRRRAGSSLARWPRAMGWRAAPSAAAAARRLRHARRAAGSRRTRALPPLRVSGVQARQTALHLVRFLRAAGVELDAGDAGAQRASGDRGRQAGMATDRRLPAVAARARRDPLGHRSTGGPPGVTAITVHAPDRRRPAYRAAADRARRAARQASSSSTAGSARSRRRSCRRVTCACSTG